MAAFPIAREFQTRAMTERGKGAFLLYLTLTCGIMGLKGKTDFLQ
jgi:hypothetical protein